MAKAKVKPKVFIGSSSESKYLALALQVELQGDAEPEGWWQGLFRLGDVPLETLLRAPDGFDFAVFLFSPDDVTKIRDKVQPTVRDNVLFELGVFLARLGRDRSFFVMPVHEEELHLPSDLKGITYARYNANESNAKIAMSQACFDIITAIKALGPLHRSSTILYDLSQGSGSHFHGKESCIYKDGKAITEKAKGQLSIDRDLVLRVDRSNTAGKFEVQLRPHGPKKPSFMKLHDPPPRCLHVSCEARVEGGSHTLSFIVKDEAEEEWLDKEQKREVSSQDWTKIDIYLWLNSTIDFLLRIDDKTVTQVPSSLFIRNLSVVELLN